VVETVNAAGDALSVAAVSAKMPDAKRDTVGWALWKAADEGLLKKIAQGIYAPLDYTPPKDLQPSLNGSRADEGDKHEAQHPDAAKDG
jgi:hypothetical protein